jgi:hypothetical protein
MLVLNVAEVSEMLTSWASLPDSMEEATEYIEGWVEHMRAGGFRCGRTILDGLPASTVVGASQPGEGRMLVLSIEEVALMVGDYSIPLASEREARRWIEDWVERMRALEIPCGRTIEDAPAELGEL